MTKIVITAAAGKGVRLLPFSIEMPKEMTLLDKNLSKIKIVNDSGITVTGKKNLM